MQVRNLVRRNMIKRQYMAPHEEASSCGQLHRCETPTLQPVETGFQSPFIVVNKVLRFPEGGDPVVSTSTYDLMWQNPDFVLGREDVCSTQGLGFVSTVFRRMSQVTDLLLKHGLNRSCSLVSIENRDDLEFDQILPICHQLLEESNIVTSHQLETSTEVRRDPTPPVD